MPFSSSWVQKMQAVAWQVRRRPSSPPKPKLKVIPPKQTKDGFMSNLLFDMQIFALLDGSAMVTTNCQVVLFWDEYIVSNSVFVFDSSKIVWTCPPSVILSSIYVSRSLSSSPNIWNFHGVRAAHCSSIDCDDRRAHRSALSRPPDRIR